MDKPGWFLLAKMCQKHSWKSDILSKDADQNVTLLQVFFKHYASKNQLCGFYISGTLVKNGLITGLINNSWNYRIFTITFVV